MKRYHTITLATLFATTFVVSASNIDSLNLKYMYEGAKEIEMLNRSMEAGMKQHNQKVRPILTEIIESKIDNSSIEDFQDLGNRYYLEKTIENGKSAKVTVKVHGDMLKITTTTTKEKQITTVHGTTKSSYTSSSVEELPIPFDGDIQNIQKVYKNGVLKITIPKKKKLK
jgi:HSP20 family molecular chaperone IbpA